MAVIGLGFGAAPRAAGAEDAGAYLSARAAATANDYDLAAQFFAQALLADPANPYLGESAVVTNIGRGDLPRALAIAREMATGQQASQVAHLLLLAEAAKAGDWAAVTAQLDAGPKTGRLLEGLVRAWGDAGAGRMAEATARFDALSAEEGMRAFGLYHKVLALAMVGDYEGAEALFAAPGNAALSASRRGLAARIQVLSQLERDEEALRLLDEAYSAEPDPATAALRARLAAGERVPFTTVTSASDGVAEAFLTLASALSSDSADIFALLYARLGAYLRPDLSETVLLTAAILDRQGQHDLATRVYDSVPAGSSAHLAAEMGRADALAAQRKADAALEVLKGLAKTYPANALVWSSMGDLMRREARFAEAIPAYDRLIALTAKAGGTGWASHYARGICLERLGNWAGAEADFRKALELQPDQPLVLNYLGYSYIEKGVRLEEAVGMIERAAAARPDDGAILDSLGWGLYRLGRLGEAVRAMEGAVERMPQDALVNDHLGDVYWAMGRQREAQFQWRRALSFGPEDEKDAARIRAKLARGLDTVLAEESARGAAPRVTVEN